MTSCQPLQSLLCSLDTRVTQGSKILFLTALHEGSVSTPNRSWHQDERDTASREVRRPEASVGDMDMDVDILSKLQTEISECHRHMSLTLCFHDDANTHNNNNRR